MKALSVRQPFAWLIATGQKTIENRTWSTLYRGPLLIHAGKRLYAPLAEIEKDFGVPIDPAALQFGGIIAQCELIDVVTESSSRWFVGPFGWVLTAARPVRFRPLRGQLVLFDA